MDKHTCTPATMLPYSIGDPRVQMPPFHPTVFIYSPDEEMSTMNPKAKAFEPAAGGAISERRVDSVVASVRSQQPAASLLEPRAAAFELCSMERLRVAQPEGLQYEPFQWQVDTPQLSCGSTLSPNPAFAQVDTPPQHPTYTHDQWSNARDAVFQWPAEHQKLDATLRALVANFQMRTADLGMAYAQHGLLYHSMPHRVIFRAGEPQVYTEERKFGLGEFVVHRDRSVPGGKKTPTQIQNLNWLKQVLQRVASVMSVQSCSSLDVPALIATVQPLLDHAQNLLSQISETNDLLKQLLKKYEAVWQNMLSHPGSWRKESVAGANRRRRLRSVWYASLPGMCRNDKFAAYLSSL